MSEQLLRTKPHFASTRSTAQLRTGAVAGGEVAALAPVGGAREDCSAQTHKRRLVSRRERAARERT